MDFQKESRGLLRQLDVLVPPRSVMESLTSGMGVTRLPWWLNSKESTYQCRRRRFDPWVRKIPGDGRGNPLQYSCLEKPMDKGAWQATVHGVTRVRHNLAAKQQQ